MSGSPDRGGYALVTGGAVRLGAAMVRRLADEGWPVAIHCHRSIREAADLGREAIASGGRAHVVCADLSYGDGLSVIFDAAGTELGTHCSVLVNSASAFEYDDISNVSAERLRQLFDVNLHAPLLLSRAFAEQLPDGAHGLIVNILDQKVFNPNPDFLSYSLTKHALEAATRLLAQAMAPRVRVCGIAPGLTLRSGDQSEDGFRKAHAATPLGLGSTPQDIAEALSFLTKVPSITGTTIVVDGGQHLEARSHDVMFSYGIAPDAPVGRKR